MPKCTQYLYCHIFWLPRMKTISLAVLLTISSLLIGCDRVSNRGASAILEVMDAHSDIYGKWRAEGLAIGGLSLPIAPSLEFTREQVILDGKATRIEKFEMREKSVTVFLADGPSLTFEMLDSYTMTFALPVGGAVKYKKVQ